MRSDGYGLRPANQDVISRDENELPSGKHEAHGANSYEVFHQRCSERS